jgi:hypothetical protein
MRGLGAWLLRRAAAAAARLPRGGSGLLLTSLHRFNKQNAHSLHYCGRLYTPTKKNYEAGCLITQRPTHFRSRPLRSEHTTVATV